MALKVVFTKRAAQGYAEIVQYLEENWTEKELDSFEIEVETFLRKLVLFPNMLKPSRKNKIRRGPINSLTMLTYRVNLETKQIEVLNLRSTRKYPRL